MEPKLTGAETSVPRDGMKSSARVILVKCSYEFLEATIVEKNQDDPKVSTFFNAIRLRFLRWVVSYISLDPIVESRQVFDQVNRIQSLISLSKSPLQETAPASSMLVPKSYNEEIDLSMRTRLNHVLKEMGDVHTIPENSTDSSSSASRAQPVINHPALLEPLLSLIKSLEDNPELRQQLQTHCAEELKRVEDKDIALLAGVAEEDGILQKEIQRRQPKVGHTYLTNIASVSATAHYGNQINDPNMTTLHPTRHHYESNTVTDTANAQYGDRYGR